MAYGSVLPPDTAVTLRYPWLALTVPWDAPQRIVLSHMVNLEGAQHFLPPLPPRALLPPVATQAKQDRAQGSSSSGGWGRALERAG